MTGICPRYILGIFDDVEGLKILVFEIDRKLRFRAIFWYQTPNNWRFNNV
jgi:hypothetical protein